VSILLRKGEKTRQKIIRKAAPVFNRRGFSGTSLSELMEETGLEKGGIYRHFESKEDLAVAAFDFAWSQIKHIRLEAVDAIPSPLARLHRMVDSFASKPSVVPGGCALMNTAIDADDGNPLLRARARSAMHEWIEYIENTVRQGIAQGEITQKTSATSVASVMIATLEGSLMITRLTQNQNALCLAREHLHGMLNGIAAKLR
jgi:TetR/AcrR family transcriptional repressor of nem operon